MANKPLRSIKFPGLPDTYTIDSGLSEAAKQALLSCFRHVAWTDEHGQDYYNALASALYSETYPKIVADFNPGVNVIYTDDELNTLKQYLTVKYYANAGDSGTTIPANNYTLSGMLTVGASAIVVSYNNLTTTFIVNGVVDFYNVYTWTMGENAIKAMGGTDPNVDAVPSRVKIYATDNDNYSTRRTLVVNHGKAPFYQYDSDKTSGSNYHTTNYYPIPMPLTANHIKITTGSTPLDIYVHFVPYDSSNNSYDNSPWLGNRITWTTFPASKIIEKDIVPDENGKQLFVLMNMRYTSSSTFPTEPIGVKIEFSEV